MTAHFEIFNFIFIRNLLTCGMKKLVSIVASYLLISVSAKAQEELSIEKQLVGIVGAISGTVKLKLESLNWR